MVAEETFAQKPAHPILCCHSAFAMRLLPEVYSQTNSLLGALDTHMTTLQKRSLMSPELTTLHLVTEDHSA